MKTALPLALVALLALPALAEEKDATAKAKKAVETWVALVDAGKYEKSWETAGAMFKAAVTKEGWAQAAKAAREPLGAKKSRKFKTSTFAKDLPGAPEGEYVITQWDTAFENHEGVETITASHEKDGSWKVVGYFVK